MGALKELFFRSQRRLARRWDAERLEFEESTLPWVDRDSFPKELARRLSRGQITEEEAACLRQWHEEGYFILRGLIASDLLDAMWEDYEQAWQGRPVCKIDCEGQGVVFLSEAKDRDQIPNGHFRLHDFYNLSEAARRIAMHPAILRFFKGLFEDTPVCMQSLTFEYGTEQELHQDFAYVQSGILSHLGAVWIACEEIGPDCGPLLVYPGSHRIRKFDFGGGRIIYNFKEPLEPFYAHLKRECQRMGLKPKAFVAKKGDVLFWHSALIHGGSPTHTRALTRKSFAVHYTSMRAYPRDARTLDLEPKSAWMNGGILYEWQEKGHVENRYRLPPHTVSS